MGNILSEENLKIELYNWSSEGFPKEQALIYTSPTDNKTITVVRLRVNREKVVLSVVDALHAENPMRLVTEVTADKNENQIFKFGAVKVIADRRSYLEYTHRHGTAVFAGSCSTFILQGRRGNFLYDPRKKMTWQVFHQFKVSILGVVGYLVNIECDAVTGLSAKFRGPFKFEFPYIIRESLLERLVSQIQRQVNGEPPKDVIAITECALIGYQYVIFQRRNEASANSLRTSATNSYPQSLPGNEQFNIHNNGQFRGPGSGSVYKDCSIVMQYHEDATKM